jgi:hypothetical protein
LIKVKNIAEEFYNHTLPKASWTHHAHLAVALFEAHKTKDFNVALENLRRQIKSYNISVGTENNENSGYHETLTVFWLTVVFEYYKSHNQSEIDEVYVDLINSQLFTSDLPFKFYSRELLFTKEARQLFIEPDLNNLSHIKDFIQM